MVCYIFTIHSPNVIMNPVCAGCEEPTAVYTMKGQYWTGYVEMFFFFKNHNWDSHKLKI